MLRLEARLISRQLRYLHFQVVPTVSPYSTPPPEGYPPALPTVVTRRLLSMPEDKSPLGSERMRKVAQWINCDLRHFDYSQLGQ
jgi:hypothetical protein